MSTHGDCQRKEPRNAVLECLANGRRRRVLDVLRDSRTPVGERALARELAATINDEPIREVTDEEARTTHLDLVHRQLPALQDVDLVDWDPEEGTVAPTADPTLADPPIEGLVDTQLDGSDDVLRSLANPRRRIALSVLRKRGTSMTRTALAREVTIRVPDDHVDSACVEDRRRSLHHVHLPMLADAGLIEYDPVDGNASYVGHPALNEDCLDRIGDVSHPIPSTAE